MHVITILFIILSVIAAGAGIMMLLSKNPVHSVLWLIVVFFSISGHYILMNAQFLAVVNIIVYAGAIMVLFLFVVMMMNLNKDTEPVKNYRLHLMGVIAGGCLLMILLSAIMKTNAQHPMQMKIGDAGLVNNLGMTLFTQYLVPFEISSVLFLSAIIGAVILGKKD